MDLSGLSSLFSGGNSQLMSQLGGESSMPSTLTGQIGGKGLNQASAASNIVAGLLPKDQNLGKIKSQGTKEAARKIAASGAEAALGPGLGTAVAAGINLTGGMSDALRNVECDEVTGECVDKTTGAKSFIADNLDVVGSTAETFENLFSGNFNELTPWGKAKAHKARLEKMRQRQANRGRVETETSMLERETDHILNQRRNILNKGSVFGTYKKGGLMNHKNLRKYFIKYQGGGELTRTANPKPALPSSEAQFSSNKTGGSVEAVQKALNQMIERGQLEAAPLDEDGAWGDETQLVFDKAKAFFNYNSDFETKQALYQMVGYTKKDPNRPSSMEGGAPVFK